MSRSAPNLSAFPVCFVFSRGLFVPVYPASLLITFTAFSRVLLASTYHLLLLFIFPVCLYPRACLARCRIVACVGSLVRRPTPVRVPPALFVPACVRTSPGFLGRLRLFLWTVCCPITAQIVFCIRIRPWVPVLLNCHSDRVDGPFATSG